MMGWRITTKFVDAKALHFCKAWLCKFHHASLEHVAVKRGKPGFGVYGWCDYVEAKSRPYRICLHVPGPFPFSVTTKESSVKLKLYGLKELIPPGQRVSSNNICTSNETVVVKLETRTSLSTWGEGLVFLFGHELHHYLSAEQQLGAEDNEYNADCYGRLLLDQFRKVCKK